jgi:HK97 family phage major capsid protein
MVLWRLNVVETTVMPEGEFLVGAGAGAQVFDREESAVEVSTDHADYFVRNLVAIRAEERLALCESACKKAPVQG